MSKLLINDHPLIVSPRLAEAIGLNEAIILQQVHYWLEEHRQAADERHQHNGQWWVYNTVEDWQATNFPFWSVSTVRRGLESLREKELLIIGCYNRKGYDRTLWYTINYETLAQVEQDICSEWTNGNAQDEQQDDTKLDAPIPETTIDFSENLVDAKASTPKGQKHQGRAPPKQTALSPHTPEQEKLFTRLRANAQAKGRSGPLRFPSIECMDKYDAAAAVLGENGELDKALKKALEQGAISVVRATNYVAKWASNIEKQNRPQIIQVSQ